MTIFDFIAITDSVDWSAVAGCVVCLLVLVFGAYVTIQLGKELRDL